MAVLDRIAAARDDVFAARVAMILMKTATDVANEDPGTTNHANRIAFAHRVFRAEVGRRGAGHRQQRDDPDHHRYRTGAARRQRARRRHRVRRRRRLQPLGQRLRRRAMTGETTTERDAHLGALAHKASDVHLNALAREVSELRATINDGLKGMVHEQRADLMTVRNELAAARTSINAHIAKEDVLFEVFRRALSLGVVVTASLITTLVSIIGYLLVNPINLAGGG